MPTANATNALTKRRAGGRERNKNQNRHTHSQLYLENLSKLAIRWILRGAHLAGALKDSVPPISPPDESFLRGCHCHSHLLRGTFCITYSPFGCFSCVDRNEDLLKDDNNGRTQSMERNEMTLLHLRKIGSLGFSKEKEGPIKE